MSTLATLLQALADVDAKAAPDYAARNRLTLFAMAAASMEGIAVGIRIDPAEPEWPVVYFELPEPAAQISFHLPQHPFPWDGHTKAEARSRIGRFIEFTSRTVYITGADGVRYGPFDVPPRSGLAAALTDDQEQAEPLRDPTGVDCAERYEGTDDEEINAHELGGGDVLFAEDMERGEL